MSLKREEEPLLRWLDRLIEAEGFCHWGIAPAVNAEGFSSLLDWISLGYAGEMDYFQRRVDAYAHPRGVLHGVRSLVMLALPYPTAHPPVPVPMRDQQREGQQFREPVPQGSGRLARYLWDGDDYHDVIHEKLRRLGGALASRFPEGRFRGVVDTAPLLEREYARLAGIGWQGKNTLLINKWTGSYFFLAALLTDLDLPSSTAHATDHCGTCTRCLDACPTDAFPQAGVLDSRRCISYLTIEHRGPIPTELRPGIGDWLMGCDICQEVCPWNRPRAASRARPSDRALLLEHGLLPDHARPDHRSAGQLELRTLFYLSDEEFRARFRHTPLWRVKRRGVLRNAAIVLGNQRAREALESLAQGLDDPEPMVRAACAWGISCIGGGDAETLLGQRLRIEVDTMVISELQRGLGIGG